MEKFISDFIKKRRIEANLSQEELAAKVNVEVRTIRRIENHEVKHSQYLKDVCKALNISFLEANPDEILSVHKSVNKPNIKSGRDLVHLLLHVDHLEYHPDPAEILEEDDLWAIDDFMRNITEYMEVLDLVQVNERQFFIDKFNEELVVLNNQGIYIYGSCNDTLVNDFKYTELVFVKL